MTRKPLSHEEIERVITMRNHGYSFRSIAIKMNRDYYTVKRVVFPDFEKVKKSVPDGFFDVDEFAKNLTV